VAKIGEGWFSRVYLAELVSDRSHEIAVKAISCKTVQQEEFARELHYARLLSAHRNVLNVVDVDGLSSGFRARGYFMFCTEYAPMGDLTAHVGDGGIGEQCTKRVAKQVGIK